MSSGERGGADAERDIAGAALNERSIPAMGQPVEKWRHAAARRAVDCMHAPREEILLFDNEDVAAIRTHRWKYVELTYYRGHAVSCSDRGVPSYFRTREVVG